MQKNKNRAATSKEVCSLPQAPPAQADHLSYDDGDYFPSYFEVEPSGASDTACHGEGGQSLSPPQATASARTTTSKESSLALMADSRSVTPGTKTRLITLLIEDRHHGTDELAEVHLPFKIGGESVWADVQRMYV